MASVIGIFDDLYKNKTFDDCKTSTQTRRFTVINDTTVCYEAWKK